MVRLPRHLLRQSTRQTPHRPDAGGCSSVDDARPFLNHLHLELGHIRKRPAKIGTTLPQQGRIVLGGALLTDADQYHLFWYACLVHRHPHEHPRRWEAPVGTELMRAGQAHWASARVATPLSPIHHGFVQVPERRVLLNSPLPQHFGTDYFGVVLPAVVA